MTEVLLTPKMANNFLISKIINYDYKMNKIYVNNEYRYFIV